MTGTISANKPQVESKLRAKFAVTRKWRTWCSASYPILALCCVAMAAILSIGQSLTPAPLWAFWIGVGLVAACVFLSGLFWYKTSGLFPVVRWDCHKCGKRLVTDIDWICGSCDEEMLGWTESPSFLENCQHCDAKPRCFECYHCGALTFFFENDFDARCPARRITTPLPGETQEQARTREISDREHERRKLELDVELAKLRFKLNPPKTEKPDLRQERVNRLWEQIEDVEQDCKTIEQTVVKEKELHAKIDATLGLDEPHRNQIKSILSRKLEELRIQLGGDIRV